MLRTLLESQARRHQNSFGTAASTAIHIVLITTAAYGTVAHARLRDDEGPTPEILHWSRPSSAAPARPAPAQRESSANSQARVVRGPAISIDIAAHIPDVSIPLGVVRRDDFSTSAGGPNSITSPSTGLGSGERSGPYDSYEVDVPVSALGGVAPVYPPSMRATGVEGEVKAEFVVNAKGRADITSLRIISSTNERFSDAVGDALPKMRFTAARLRGEPVAQLVQQLFVFRLNR